MEGAAPAQLPYSEQQLRARCIQHPMPHSMIRYTSQPAHLLSVREAAAAEEKNKFIWNA